jgi:chemotaxis protein MotB
MSRARGRHGGGHGHDGPDERWLLTYSDMITLLMALFIVMWSMSSVNISRFAALKASLKEAFNGTLSDGGQNLLSGNEALLPTQAAIVGEVRPRPAQTASPVNVVDPTQTVDPRQAVVQVFRNADRQDLENLARLKREIDAWSEKHHLARQVRTEIDERGLVIRILTDDLLFDSGHAVLRPRATPVLDEVASLLRNERRVPNAIRVEGNTDNVPISTAEFSSNWSLSTRRATVVLESLLGRGITAERLAAVGYADQRPLTSNATAAGRAVNRRVELVVVRRALIDGAKGGTP